MNRFLVGTLILAGGFAAGDVRPAAAQLSANVQISWHWSDDGWRSGPVVDGYVRTVYRDRAPVRVRPAPRARVRIPPGHMPPPGLCRVWLMGVPPGHQPPPRPCSRALLGYRGADVVILHTPARDGRYWAPDRWRERRDWDDDWDDDDWDDDDWDDDDWDDDWDDDDWDDDDRWDDDRRRPGRGGPPGRGRGRGGRG